MPNAPVEIPREFIHSECGQKMRIAFRRGRDFVQGKPFEIDCPTCGKKVKSLSLTPVVVEPKAEPVLTPFDEMKEEES